VHAVNVLNLRWAIRFWIRLLSSGSVTSVQSSVFFLDDDEDLSFLEAEEDECLDVLEDILDGSLSVSEPDWGEGLLPFRLLRLFPERVKGGGESLLCLGVVECLLLCSASSHSSSESYGWWTFM
jgi:hypothetical protein